MFSILLRKLVINANQETSLNSKSINQSKITITKPVQGTKMKPVKVDIKKPVLKKLKGFLRVEIKKKLIPDLKFMF